MASDLQNKISGDLNDSLKSADPLLRETLRFLSAAIHNREIEKRTKTGQAELSGEEVLEVLAREAKKRKEAAELYEKGNRPELAKKEIAELQIIKKYLPEEMSGAEIEKAVEAAVAKLQPAGAKDLGRVMGEAMKILKGRAEAGVVHRLVKERLEKLGNS
ncbi:MAG: hypothetical protein UY51_C0005G0469 [Candidatus Jorgensenbacteria bacterium GW2011_GWB1_49_9]|nr:MAG: hypothetical protein UY51_C0005G0469 [Candidatus Jorgensenbacteria bacterium GW2011_GWB1_49_9]